ncbi:hypothetical protein JTE90_019906 [Oedothorax gibbosus]|uniref:Uncharacterized protein n=1 Tax=Oedothorax gibbosus TaxID=931172 RepID=A0AAV6TFX3_9ARAC|nr:hypothetical protein JTE90_019906 [Oedothorax gibbosus]
MPLDVRGPHACHIEGIIVCFPFPTGMGNPLNLFRAGDWRLQLSAMNEEFLVSVSHHLALIRSLALVHTARRYYRLNILVRTSDWLSIWLSGRADVPKRCPNLII